MAILSAIPVVGDGSPLSPAIMAETRRVTEALCNDDRLLLHGQVAPSAGRPEATGGFLLGRGVRPTISQAANAGPLSGNAPAACPTDWLIWNDH